MEERERACDEEVLRLGSQPAVYAEGILKVCKFYLESPVVCVPGVTGSNIKKRIEEIMTAGISAQTEFCKEGSAGQRGNLRRIGRTHRDLDC